MSEQSMSRKIVSAAAVAGVSLAIGAGAAEANVAHSASQASVTAAEKYILSAARTTRINKVLSKFAHLVLKQDETSGSWAPFDAFCSPSNPNSNAAEGWTSQGFHPTSEDVCYVQHNPQYGGLDMQVGAEVGITAGGLYNPNNVVGAFTNKIGNCAVTFDYEGKSLGWDTHIGSPKTDVNTDTTVAEFAGDLKDAERIDNTGLACIQRVEATL
jgi:hypothetical protein